MSLYEQENMVLPGVITEIIQQYSEGYDTSAWGTTDSVTIIGTAFNGPVGKPVKIYSVEHAKYIFGGVYNSKTRQEATLVANIQDAWDRGCRTIYAIRISGKEIYKDYQLATDTNLKLRVSGLFPSNENKDIYFCYDDESQEMNIQIFKPANRATMNEKSSGLVESQEAILINKIDLYNGGLTKEDELVELISRVNSYTYNNVIKLAIVDDKGNDVTLSSVDAKAIKIGDMLPGIYTIGRSCNADNVVSDTKIDIVLDEKPYEGFEGDFYKKLKLNTNVAMDLPIYSANDDLNVILGISSVKQYDFLSTPGKIDEIFLKDKVDYEEVAITDFELYKKLGSGFAINSQIVEVADGKFKVKEVVDKSAKKTEIKDGIYSMLENLPSKYRVLSKVAADSVIKGKLPKAQEFKFASAQSVNMLNKSIRFNNLVDSKDLTAEKTYKIVFKELSEEDVTEINGVKEKLYTAKTVREVTVLTDEEFADVKASKKTFLEGSLFLVTDITSDEYLEEVNLLYSYSNGKFKCLHNFSANEDEDFLKGDLIYGKGKIYICNKQNQKVGAESLKNTSFVAATQSDFGDKKYAIVSLFNGTFVIAKFADVRDELGTTPLDVSILGTAGTILGEFDNEDDKLIIALSSSYNDNSIIIASNQFDYLTIAEISDLLNEDKDFSKLFSIDILNLTGAQDFIYDMIHPNRETTNEITETIKDRKITYDTTLLIPFRTEDTFARQLAQHCMYTSLKTYPTHGVVGSSILLDTSLESIANKVKSLVSLNLDSSLVAKKGNGTNMLDKDNMPFPIGRKISVTCGQYKITTSDNYTFISNMAAGYAGMVSKLPLDQSSTCQPIDIPDLMYELTNYQLTSLTSAGYVTIKKSYSQGWVITDGITMATSESPYRRLSATRIADGIEDILRSVCEPYIGQQNNTANQNSLRTAIKSNLEKLKDKLIESYDFDLLIDKASMQLGVINIAYTIVPIYEIKQINNKITIKN